MSDDIWDLMLIATVVAEIILVLFLFLLVIGVLPNKQVEIALVLSNTTPQEQDEVEECDAYCVESFLRSKGIDHNIVYGETENYIKIQTWVKEPPHPEQVCEIYTCDGKTYAKIGCVAGSVVERIDCAKEQDVIE